MKMRKSEESQKKWKVVLVKMGFSLLLPFEKKNTKTLVKFYIFPSTNCFML